MIEFMMTFMVIFMVVMIAMYVFLERGSGSIFFIPLLIIPMILIFSFFFTGGDFLVVDESDFLYSEDDIFRVVISTDNEYKNVIIEYVDISWDWLSDNDFIDDNGELNRNSFFWEQVVRDAGLNNVNEVYVNLDVR